MENKDKNKKTSISRAVMVIILGAFLIFFYVTTTKLSNMENTINNLQQSLSEIQMDQSGQCKQISNLISESMESQTYLNIDPEWTSEYKNGEIHLTFNAVINKASKQDNAFIFYKDINKSQWQTSNLQNTQGLNYSGLLTLDTFKQYEYYVMLDNEYSIASKIKDIPEEYYYVRPTFLHGSEIGLKNGKDNSIVLHWRTQKDISISGITYDSYDINIFHGDSCTTQRLQSIPQEGITIINFDDFTQDIDKITIVATLPDGKQITQTVYDDGEKETQKQ